MHPNRSLEHLGTAPDIPPPALWLVLDLSTWKSADDVNLEASCQPSNTSLHRIGGRIQRHNNLAEVMRVFLYMPTSPSQSLLAPFQVLLQLFSTPSFLQFLVPVRSKTCPKPQDPQVTWLQNDVAVLLDLLFHEICHAGTREHGKTSPAETLALRGNLWIFWIPVS